MGLIRSLVQKSILIIGALVLLLQSLLIVPATAAAAGANLVANPSVETATSATVPQAWTSDKWGTNQAAFTYTQTAGNTGTKSLSVNMTSRTSGDAKWHFTNIAVKPNQKYTYTEFYKSNVQTEIDVEYTDTSNKLSYKSLATPAASTAWKQQTVTFTTPANVKSLTIFHLIAKVGNIQTDDFSLIEGDGTVTPPPATAPTVSISAPATGSTVSGTQTVSATATDAVGVSGVQFKVDGTNLTTEDTTSPYSASWNTTTVANGTHTLTATARNAAGLTSTATTTVNVQNVVTPPPATAPTVSITAPTTGATVSNTQNITANASDAVGVSGVQFKVDGTNVGAEDTAAPYSTSWDTKTVINGNHTVTATARNAAGLTTTSTVTVNVQNATAPTVSFSAPASGATVSNTQAISANASDTIGMAGVQFKLDGANLGSEDTTAPYGISWDTKTAANGAHTLTAVARNTSGLTASTTINVIVQNVVTPPPPATTNLIANPSFETAQDATTPQNWLTSSWGTNTSAFSYLSTGHTGSRSVKTEITSYTDGAANWFYNSVPVTAGKTYRYENWYQSNVDSEIDAEVIMSDGSTQYFYLTTATASSAWAKVSASFTVPAGATSMTVYQILAKKGYVIADDYSLSEYTPAQFNRAMVSLTFDDGWRSIYTNGLPLLNKYGLASTQYLNSQPTTDGYTDYMTYQQIKEFIAAGNEVAWHTRTHADLTTLSASAMNTELTIPSAFLTGVGQSATAFQNFATPFGTYNSSVINAIKSKYRSHRSTDVGFNSKDSFDIYNIRVQNITNTTTPAQVQVWISQALAEKTWLVLVYHEVDAAAEDPTYAVTPANLDQELNIVKQSGITVKTVNNALNEILSQL